MAFKRSVYLAAFVVFGLLAQFLIHAGIEMAAIELLVSDFERYGLGLSWRQWYAIHGVLSTLLAGAGAIIGWRLGVYWWNVIYVEKRFGWPPRLRNRK